MTRITVVATRCGMRANGMAKEIGVAVGFIKGGADADDIRLLAAAMLGRNATELIHIDATAMNPGAPWMVLGYHPS